MIIKLNADIKLRKKFNKNSSLVLIAIAVFSIPLLFSINKKLYLNFTKSMPVGLYLTILDNSYNIGDIIVFYSDIKKCNLIKYVLAIEGDEYCVEDGKALWLNDLPQAVLNIQKYGQNLYNQSFCKILKKGQILVLGEHPDSFDSRYFGPINEKQIISKVTLLIKLR